MPFDLNVNTNAEHPSITVQFTDANGQPIATPSGAQVEFTIDNPGVAELSTDPQNPLKCNLNILEMSGSGTITINVTGANDVDGQAFKPTSLQAVIFPAQVQTIQFRQIQSS